MVLAGPPKKSLIAFGSGKAALARMSGQECNVGSRGDAPDRMSHLGDEILGVAAIEYLLVQF